MVYHHHISVKTTFFLVVFKFLLSCASIDEEVERDSSHFASFQLVIAIGAKVLGVV